MVVTQYVRLLSAAPKETDSPFGQIWVLIDRVPAMLAEEDNDVIQWN